MIFRPLIDIIKYPIITEKTTLLIESNQYSFAVDRKADKASIKAAMEQLSDVKEVPVNTPSQPCTQIQP
jgi:large subunit ribosomal protein L23